MDRVHGPGPRGGPWTPVRSMFCTRPLRGSQSECSEISEKTLLPASATAPAVFMFAILKSCISRKCQHSVLCDAQSLLGLLLVIFMLCNSAATIESVGCSNGLQVLCKRSKFFVNQDSIQTSTAQGPGKLMFLFCPCSHVWSFFLSQITHPSRKHTLTLALMYAIRLFCVFVPIRAA